MLPTSNIRGFFEILMPGIFLVLNAVFTAVFLGSILMPDQMASIEAINQLFTGQLTAITLVIVIGYPVGMALRLLKTTGIDARSAKYIARLKPKERGKLYLSDQFFYGNWMRDKVISRLPAEVARFYDEYWRDKYTGDASQNTTFFNLCKTIIAKEDSQSANEIYAAEAVSRFLAGSYYALQVAVVLMLLNIVIALARHHPYMAALPGGLFVGYFLLLHIILSQYRLLRCKEVDTVFNACFANRQAFERLFPTPASRRLMTSSNIAEVDARQDLILNAWGEHWTNDRLVQSLNLDKLIAQMKTGSQVHPYLSSLYFAGSDVDHPFFLENSRFALGMAVLPEDSPKAGMVKRHPHQTEIIVMLRGSMYIHCELDGKNEEKALREDDIFIIPPGACHWITGESDKDAVYLFIKTNPDQEPRSQPCLPSSRLE